MALLDIPQIEKEIILNTPNRNEILNQGPPQQTKTNLLGKGAFGTVFKAIYKGKQVAVKVVKNDVQLDTLLNESNIVGWNHRNIVKVIKIESTPKFGIIIMERYPGQCLQNVLDCRFTLPLQHCIFISLDILAALNYCHRQRILHLDIKPQNVLVVTDMPNRHYKHHKQTTFQRKYICKLCDFGASQQFGENKENGAKRSAKGTVRYMSPEALREQPLTPAADIYSLGITMWQLQFKQIPYFWIECNEIVAYQVVKNNLRPDVYATNNTNITTKYYQNKSKHENCYCNSLATTNITYQSVEHIKNWLKTIDLKTNIATATATILNNSIAKQQSKRKPLQLLSSNRSNDRLSNKVVRHLGFDKHNLSPGSTSAASLPTISINGSSTNLATETTAVFDNIEANFSNLFHSNLHLRKSKNNSSYESIYKSCWHADYHLRPNSTELRMRLANLL